MTFCSDEQNKNEIIGSIEINDNDYIINYLDGSKKTYTNDKIEHIKELEKIMINQAIERDKDYTFLNNKKIKNILFWFFDCLLFSFGKNVTPDLIRYFFFVMSVNYFYDYLITKLKLNELKKYRLFIDKYKSLKETDIKEIFSYGNNIDIFNIDKFTLSEIKKLKKINDKK